MSKGGIAKSNLKAMMQKERLKNVKKIEESFGDFCRIYSLELCGATCAKLLDTIDDIR